MKNMRKGVSAIIATILLLMITIGLAGMAYVFMSGMMTGRTSKTITVLDASCTSASILVVLSNDGTETITYANDIKIFVSNNQDTSVTYNPVTSLSPHASAVITGINQGVVAGNSYTVLVVSPSNAVKQVVYC